jgi:hypothetical protein
MSCAIDLNCTDPTHAYGRSTVPAIELSLTEAMLLRRFEAAPAAPESYGQHSLSELRRLAVQEDQPITVATYACKSRSHGPDGWHCAITGEHVMHLNAAGTVGWQ